MKTSLKRASSSFFARKKDESGATAVEFALLLPLLITFLFGVIIYGYILSMQQGITQSAAEGARAAAIALPTTTNATRTAAANAAINRAMTSYDATCGSNGLTCTVSYAPCVGASSFTCATVKVSYNWKANPKTPTIPLLPAPDTLEHTSVIEVS